PAPGSVDTGRFGKNGALDRDGSRAAGPERGVVVRDDKVYRSSPRMPVSQHPLVHPSPRDSGELYPFSGQDDALRKGDARDRGDEPPEMLGRDADDRVDDRIPFDGELEHLLVGQSS